LAPNRRERERGRDSVLQVVGGVALGDVGDGEGCRGSANVRTTEPIVAASQQFGAEQVAQKLISPITASPRSPNRPIIGVAVSDATIDGRPTTRRKRPGTQRLTDAPDEAALCDHPDGGEPVSAVVAIAIARMLGALEDTSGTCKEDWGDRFAAIPGGVSLTPSRAITNAANANVAASRVATALPPGGRERAGRRSGAASLAVAWIVSLQPLILCQNSAVNI